MITMIAMANTEIAYYVSGTNLSTLHAVSINHHSDIMR